MIFKFFLVACLLVVFTHAADDQAAAEGEVDHKKIVESLRGQILAKSPAEVKPETNPEIVFKSVQSLPTPVNVLGATHHYVYELAIGGKDATVNVDQIGPSNTVKSVNFKWFKTHRVAYFSFKHVEGFSFAK